MRVFARLTARFAPILVLAACVGQAAPAAMAYDAAPTKTAEPQHTPPKPAPPTVAAKPAPLIAKPPPPLLTSAALKPVAPSPKRRVLAANRKALAEPTTFGYLNAVQVYPYTDGVLYRLYAAPEQVTDIALQPGETLSSVSAGDTVRWIVGDTTSGVGATKQVHVLVKPSGPGLKTNLVMMTDRRSYHLVLESTDRTAMAVISWTYPQDQLIALQHQAKAADDAQPIASGVALEDLHFRYAITGDNPPWKPVRAFDDGAKVYIQFPDRIDLGEAPPLFVVGPGGGSQLVNYRVRRNYYIVDRLFAAADLRLGQKPQQAVRITRTDASSGSGASAPSKSQ